MISGHKSSDLSIAKNLGISFYFAETFSLKSQTDKNFFKKKSFDLGFCTSWQRIIPADILNLFTFGVARTCAIVKLMNFSNKTRGI